MPAGYEMEIRPIDANALRREILKEHELHSNTTGWQMLVNVISAISCSPTLPVVKNEKLTIKELKELPDGKWVWIELSNNDTLWPSAYYQKEPDFTRGRAFCCGYPTHSFFYDYKKYGKSWTAYRYEPLK